MIKIGRTSQKKRDIIQIYFNVKCNKQCANFDMNYSRKKTIHTHTQKKCKKSYGWTIQYFDQNFHTVFVQFAKFTGFQNILPLLNQNFMELSTHLLIMCSK